MSDQLAKRNKAEIERSAGEAKTIVLPPIDRVQIDRYLAPPADTPYGLEYAFHLLGNIHGKTVLDLGCGTGENIIPLIERGARVIGIDISPDLISLAERRLQNAGRKATLRVGSAYDTALESETVDVIFCIALIHHLDIVRVRDEMLRILAPGGIVILKEPIRFSKTYAFLRSLLPAQENVSEYEHPLTPEELAIMTTHFDVRGLRYFRLPWVPLVDRLLPSLRSSLWKADRWVLQRCPATERYSTMAAMKLVKPER